MIIKNNKTRILSVRDRLNITGQLYIRLRTLSTGRRLATRRSRDYNVY
jgi:hypothetical protein